MHYESLLMGTSSVSISPGNDQINFVEEGEIYKMLLFEDFLIICSFFVIYKNLLAI